MVSEIRQGYDFFQNRACQYFPCHKGADAENFSCLFCYCPLYALGRRCGGAFRYTPSGVKDCSRCAFPHKRENYDAVLERYAEIADVVRRMDAIPDGDWKMEGKSMREWKAAALDGAAMAAAQARWDAVAKPLNSLGLWEAWVVRIAGMQGTPDVRIAPRCALVFCADHGVVEEGVSQSGSEVTALVAQSVAEGAANVNLMAAAAGAKAFAVDMGMARDVAHPDMIVLKQAKGTANFTRGPAMPREAAERAVESGADLVARMKERGYRMIATGEMGIGNTTAATAVSCALLGRAPCELTGRGAGLSDAGLLRKISAIERALEGNRPILGRHGTGRAHRDRRGDFRGGGAAGSAHLPGRARFYAAVPRQPRAHGARAAGSAGLAAAHSCGYGAGRGHRRGDGVSAARHGAARVRGRAHLWQPGHGGL